MSGLTVGCWVNIDNTSANAYVLSKYLSTGNQRSWLLMVDTTPQWQFQVSGDGLAGQYVLSLAADVKLSTWTFLVGRYNPSTEIKLWVNDTVYTNTTSIPAAIYASTAKTAMAVNGDLTARFLPGKIAFPFLCNSVLADDVIEKIYQKSRLFFGV